MPPSTHFLTKSAVHLFLFNDTQQILLQKRQNTGYMDGMWDCSASGHVEKNESMKTAMQREAKEELNILLHINDIHFATLTHRHNSTDNSTYYNGYFYATAYTNTPIINEPRKCSDLQWFPINALPKTLINHRITALSNYLKNIPYSEEGWDVFNT
jgi:8-oxo-dGTP pyrophosphatase MutT (NUDIX family)